MYFFIKKFLFIIHLILRYICSLMIQMGNDICETNIIFVVMFYGYDEFNLQIHLNH